jgi:hypothetical protein
VWGRLRDCKRVTCIECGGRRGHRKSDHMHENGRQFEDRVRVALKDTSCFDLPQILTLFLMRIRLSSETPALKAWYNVGDSSTISALKNALCADVRTFKDAGVQPAAIELLLDDFGLLDESTTDVLHEGDILWYVELLD